MKILNCSPVSMKILDIYLCEMNIEPINNKLTQSNLNLNLKNVETCGSLKPRISKQDQLRTWIGAVIIACCYTQF